MKGQWIVGSANGRRGPRSLERILISFLATLVMSIAPLPVLLRSQSLKPLSEERVETLLKSQMSAHRIAALVQEREVDFQLSSELERQFRALGANDEVIEAIRHSYTKPPVTAATSSPPEAPTRAELASQLYGQGQAYSGQAKWDAAIKEYEEAIKVKPDDAKIYGAWGYALAKKGDLDGAIAEDRQALRLTPKDFEVQNNLGAALSAKGDVDGAIRQYREALRVAPDDAETHNNLGVVLGKKGDQQAAAAEYQKAVKLDPTLAVAWYDLAIALSAEKDTEGSANAMRRAVRLKPDWPEARLNLGAFLEQQHDDASALAEYLETLRLRPDDGLAGARAGLILTEEGCWKEAVRPLQSALFAYPNQALEHAALARALYYAGDLQGSSQQYEAASRLDSKNKKLKAISKKVSSELRKRRGASPKSQAPESPACEEATNFAALLPRVEEQVYQGGRDATWPVPVYDPDPPYPSYARQAKVQGTVGLAIVVDEFGNVQSAQVTKPLGLGLDHEALRAVKTWKFRPAVRNGVPVAVRLTVEIHFRLL
jgi:TonB family protein